MLSCHFIAVESVPLLYIAGYAAAFNIYLTAHCSCLSVFLCYPLPSLRAGDTSRKDEHSSLECEEEGKFPGSQERQIS